MGKCGDVFDFNNPLSQVFIIITLSDNFYVTNLIYPTKKFRMLKDLDIDTNIPHPFRVHYTKLIIIKMNIITILIHES